MDKAVEHAANALEMVLEASQGEKVVIFCDDVRQDVADTFARAALKLGLYARLVVFETKDVRKEPPAIARELAVAGWADIYMNFLRGMAEETPFRIKLVKLETRNPRRLAHCPGTSMDMLLEGALALSKDEYQKMQGTADNLMSLLTGAKSVRITNAAGTDVTLTVEDRGWFTDTKVDWKKLKWMNLPVGEVIVGPHEHAGGGKIVCDVAVGGIGPISTPVTIDVRDGRAAEVACKDTKALERINKGLATDKMSAQLGEFAFGLNPHARNVEEFVETEKIGGTVHIAFGNNSDYPGGRNHGGNHMDFLMSAPTVEVTFASGTKTVMEKGKFKI
ncbi:MAG: aminopeptidase [Planctomycetota bacterium]|jgi:leucyl aminopeptidase (aminopeptidase T)